MKQRNFIFLLLLSILLIIFVLQNTKPVEINLFFWHISASRALVLFVSIVFGALLSYLFSLGAYQEQRRTMKNQKKTISKLETEREELKKEVEDLKQSQHSSGGKEQASGE
ncbi:MAG: LapA family protein [Bacteroidales bacterium]|nr:LapA family protein [Bacteroidales bacterium]